jgi:hypothetical protein
LKPLRANRWRILTAFIAAKIEPQPPERRSEHGGRQDSQKMHRECHFAIDYPRYMGYADNFGTIGSL